MKIIISESQFSDLYIIRRFEHIKQLVDEMMDHYSPCDYVSEEDDYGSRDYHNDVISSVIGELIREDLKRGIDLKHIGDLRELVFGSIHHMFLDKTREYFDKIINEECNEDYYN